MGPEEEEEEEEEEEYTIELECVLNDLLWRRFALSERF